MSSRMSIRKLLSTAMLSRQFPKRKPNGYAHKKKFPQIFFTIRILHPIFQTKPSSNMTFSQANAQTQWYQDTEMLNDEELFASLEDWETDDVDIMEVDEQIGSDLLGDDLFGAPCVSPTGPLEEMVLMNEESDDRFFSTILATEENSSAPQYNSSLALDERYAMTLRKLQESMKRSQETRKFLKIKTKRTEKYARTKSVSGVLSSIESSSRQVQSYLKTLQRPM